MNKFDKLAKGLAQSVTRRALRKLCAGSAAITLACFGLVTSALAQTSVVCDPAGDASSSTGKGGPTIPPWLDIIRAEVSGDTTSNIVFTLTLNAPLPTSPAWRLVDDGGQLWWGWRIVDDLATDFLVQNHCIKGAGQSVPAGYFLDLIWDVQSSSFHARLLDDTSCSETAVPVTFSSDRTQVTMVVAKSLLANTALIPNPNMFQFFATTTAWKANSTGNDSFFDLDNAPNNVNGQLSPATWSATSNATYFCP